MDLRRLLHHLLAENWALRRTFPKGALDNIERAIAADEKRHGGELRFAVEGGLPLTSLLRGQSPRERAIELFGMLRVWDTEQNCGVLIYLSLGDRDVEIVADRGIQKIVGNDGWLAICDRMQQQFREGRFEQGVVEGVQAIGRVLVRHFPTEPGDINELPDRPLVI